MSCYLRPNRRLCSRPRKRVSDAQERGPHNPALSHEALKDLGELLPQVGRDFVRTQVYIDQTVVTRFPDVNIADLQAGKCEIGMFGVGATLKRAQAVEFSKPYLITNIYLVTRKDSKVKKGEDLDQKGINAAASLGSYIASIDGQPGVRVIRQAN